MRGRVGPMRLPEDVALVSDALVVGVVVEAHAVAAGLGDGEPAAAAAAGQGLEVGCFAHVWVRRKREDVGCEFGCADGLCCGQRCSFEVDGDQNGH